MKKVLSVLSLCFLVGAVSADIEFGTENALLRINSSGHGVAFEYDPVVPYNQTTGRVQFQPGISYSGVPLEFSNGQVVESNTVYAQLTNVAYEPGCQAALFTMSGASTVEAFNNFAIQRLTVNDPDSIGQNVLAGAPKLLNPIRLRCDIDLSCRLTEPLTNNIHLDGGTLTLDADLVCRSNVALCGHGNVDLGQYVFTFGDYYLSGVSANLNWISDISVIKLRGSIPLSGSWTFNNTGVIYGERNIIDLSFGGSIVIACGANLTLVDTIIRGVTQDNIIFLTDEDGSSGRLVLSDSRLELASSISFDVGHVDVYSDSMISLKDYNLTFRDDAVLTISPMTTLSLNLVSNSAEPCIGTICAPNPVYVDHQKRDENIDLNIAAGNLVIADGGAIVELTQVTLNGAGSLGVPITIDQSNILTPTDVLTFDVSATVDGGGSTIIFSNPGTPQFTVAANQTVEISNVEFRGITNTSFQLGDDAVLKLGRGVRWVLTEDVTWTAEQIQLAGVGNSFEIVSDGPVRTLWFTSPNLGTDHDPLYETHLALNANAIVLRNVELKGLRHVTYNTEDEVAGSITLAGNATLEIPELVDNHIITIEGLDNKIRLCNHDTTFEGQLFFDPSIMSSLTFSFITPLDSYRPPVVHFYDSFMNLASDTGVAYCTFDMAAVTVFNHAVNSFLIGQNAVLSGEKVTIVGNSIVQTSARATYMPGMQLLSDLTTGAVILADDLLDAMRGAPSRKITPARFYNNQLLNLTRALALPDETIKPVVHYDTAIALPELGGNIALRESYGHVYTNFRISDSRDLNLTLSDGVEVVQAAVPTTLKLNDILNVVGGTMQKPNVIKIAKDMILNGLLMMGDNSVFCIEFTPDVDPVSVSIASDFFLSCGTNSTIIFRGVGSVIFPSTFTVPLGNTNSTLVIGAGAKIDISQGQTVNVNGVGTMLCQDGGKIVVSNSSTFYLGNTDNTNGDITVRAKNGGTICVGDVTATNNDPSYFSFQRLSGAFDFSEGGHLVIANNGIVECNAYHGVYRAGVLRKIDFSNGGLLYVANTGLLRMGSNGIGDQLSLLLPGAIISGTGLIEVVGSSFLGRIQPNLNSLAGLTAPQFVSSLVQTMPTLVASTVFIGKFGENMLRTKNGVLVNLGVNFLVTSDDSDGKVVGYNTLSGRRSTYDANGVLL
jgi:hypothetical protein